MKELYPGDMFKRISEGDNIAFLIVLLSCDKEPIDDGNTWWRCASFQQGSHGELFGAQITLFTEQEIRAMQFVINFRYIPNPEE